MEYYSAIEKESAATLMELAAVMLSEISQAPKDKYRIFSLICGG